MLARPRALTQNQAKGAGGNSMSLQTRNSILPVLINRRCLHSVLIPPANCLGWGPLLLAHRHAMQPDGPCRSVVYYALLVLVDTVFNFVQA